MARGAIKTEFLGGPVNGAFQGGAAAAEAVITNWVPQEPIRIVGIEVGLVALVLDAQINADGDVNADVEISRSGQMYRPGALLHAGIKSAWTAAIVAGGNLQESRTLNLPTATGIDVDGGESLNLIAHHQWIGTGALNLWGYAIVHYTER